MNSTDIFIIGGGIHGTAIAADAAGRGLSVNLCEQNDLAAGTSSASTKLIHGGLRYLETYEFRLVKNALHERELLQQRAPHLITPLEFVLPHTSNLRPFWLIRLGLFIYDYLGKSKQPFRSSALNLQDNIRGNALLPQFHRGFSYYDCLTDDARLTITNALSAKEKGATILTQHQFISAERKNGHWEIQVKNKLTNEMIDFQSKVLINTSGPWINSTKQTISHRKKISVQLIKGSHIIVKKWYSGDFAYILQHSDHRIVFIIPYENQFSLIGTTESIFDISPENVTIDENEKKYLCNIVNHYFKKNLSEKEIIHSFSGVRCLRTNLIKNPSKKTRDYQFVLDEKNNSPLLTIIGGKLTTHRKLAEKAVNKLRRYFPKMRSSWTAQSLLPGGDFPDHDFKKFHKLFIKDFPWLPADLVLRYVKNYGTRTYILLKDAQKLSDLGNEIAKGLYEKEVDYLINHEWAKTAEDILWRRTKLGLFFSSEEKNKLLNFLKTRL